MAILINKISRLGDYDEVLMYYLGENINENNNNIIISSLL